MTYTGSCACGAVTLEISGKTLGTRQCWCRQCQQIAAGGPTNNAIFRAEDVRIDGELSTGEWPAASGNTLTFSFCPSCGAQIFAQSSARKHLVTVRIGVIDTPNDLRPEMAIWTEEAPAWAQIDPRLENYPRQPPPPQAKA
ncbi:Uncharacterized conserved protein [Novosphingobium aromaticivorans]|nr:GFA family protein [Novosphingobium aromaticivorans]SCY76168.1 Uncharacterized conserved protein [Novosphingobium aromaticivorans]